MACSMTDMGAAARAYAERGWHVFPIWWIDDHGHCTCHLGASCDRAGKHPLYSEALGLTNGFQDASADPQTVAHWWDRFPNANIGIATGAVSGIDVLDVDLAGFDAWSQLRDVNGDPPESTPRARTGSGGQHYVFCHHDGITNRRGNLPNGIDVRGDGGYIVAAPSRSGKGPYGWVRGLDEIDWQPPEWPIWLVEILRGQPGHRAEVTGARASVRGNGDGPGYQLERWINDNRNVRLTSIAGTMRRRLVGDDGIRHAIHGINQAQCVPPLEDAEVDRLVDSVLRYEPPSPEDYLRNDLGNARRLVREFGTDLKFCFTWKRWMHWTGRRWAWDLDGEIMRRAKLSTDMLLAESESILDNDQREELRSYARKCQALTKLNAMIKLAESEPEIVIHHDCLDANGWLLNCRNGTINLRTGVLQPHNPDDYITLMIDEDYDPNAPMDEFVRVVEEAMKGDPALVDYLQRSLGYMLTGNVDEDKFFIWWGAGSNAKSTIQEAVLHVLGAYGGVTDPELLLDRRGESHPTGLADLFGKRMVFAAETQMGRALNETLVKQLTGGDRIKARRMREDFWEFEPTHKLILVTNHKPTVRDNGPAFWRRVVVVPFRRVFEKEEQDRSLPAKLQAQGPGILAWLVQGCLLYQQVGLEEPEQVTETIAEYRQEQDVLGAWLDTRCEQAADYAEETSVLHDDYREWLTQGGWKIVPTIQMFGMMLNERGFAKRRDGSRIVRAGVRLLYKQHAGPTLVKTPQMRQERLGEAGL